MISICQTMDVNSTLFRQTLKNRMEFANVGVVTNVGIVVGVVLVDGIL